MLIDNVDEDAADEDTNLGLTDEAPNVENNTNPFGLADE